MRRLIIEMGMGVDLRGGDSMKAATRAIQDCLGHVALPVLDRLQGVEVRVTLGVAEPDSLHLPDLAGLFPAGKVTIAARKGGLVAQGHVVATAAVEVFVPEETGA